MCIRDSVLREEGRLEELADTGARIQMNYSSIDGGWNNNTAQWCKRQLKDGLVHYLGTDMHNSGERSPQTEHVAVSYTHLRWKMFKKIRKFGDNL